MDALVLALNPSIDAEWRVKSAQWEEKNIVLGERRWAGGKGINVARWLQFLQGNPRLILPLGGSTGGELAGYLRREKLPATIIRLREASRVNVIVTTADGRQLRFNPKGPELSRLEWLAILQKTRGLLEGADCAVLSGSLPRGISADAYATMIPHAHRAGAKTILDCDGEAFSLALRARPFLVKPNEHELGHWFGRPLRSESSILRAARELSDETGGWVLVSRGHEGGLLVNRREKREFSARPPRLKPVNTVGAGDAMVAAAVRQISLGAPPLEWLRWGVAVGTAATQCVAGHLPRRAMVKRTLKQVVVD